MQFGYDPTIAIVAGYWGLCGLIFLVAYYEIKNRTSGHERFNNCYSILSIYTILGLLLALSTASIRPINDAPLPPWVPQPPPTPYFSLDTFIVFLFIWILWSFIPWIDLANQWAKLRRSSQM